jgi:hypothetical protein
MDRIRRIQAALDAEHKARERRILHLLDTCRSHFETLGAVACDVLRPISDVDAFEAQLEFATADTVSA